MTTMAKSTPDLAKSTVLLYHERGSANPGKPTVLHSHPFWQMEFLLAGSAEIEAADARFLASAGSLILLPPGVIHRFTYLEASTSWLSIKFRASDTGDRLRVLDHDPATGTIVRALNDLLKEDGMPDESISIACAHLLDAIMALAHDATSPVSAQGPMALRIERLIERDPKEVWTVSRLARSLNLSPGHLSSRFQQETGKKIKAWLDEQRNAHAARLVRFSDLPLSQIAVQCGFADSSAFSRHFRRIQGVSARVWRCQNLNTDAS